MIELQVIPATKNSYPVSGLLIRGSNVTGWLKELQRMQLSLIDTDIYPVPGTLANSVWGCLVVLKNNSIQIDKQLTGKNELCQQVRPNIYIPEKTALYPVLSYAELEKKFSAAIHVLHPVFGFAELTEPLNPAEFITPPEMRSYYITKPADGVFIPQRITGFSIDEVTPEDAIKKLEEKIFPKKKPMPDKRLNLLEKAKLGFYRLLLKKDKTEDKNTITRRTKGWEMIGNLLRNLIDIDKLNQNLEEDFEELEKRNQSEVDKLLEMLKKDPSEALKYALPLDTTGFGRGEGTGSFILSRLWNSLSLAGDMNSYGGGSVILGNRFAEIHSQYVRSAEQLIKEGKFHDAAFIYMKLMKNPYHAAEILAQGELYEDAATIFLKHGNHQLKAAECYEKGNMLLNAISIYKELKSNEKVGDLYTALGKTKEANIYFQEAVNNFSLSNKYLNAAALCRDKMNDISQAQTLLKTGWMRNIDPTNSLAMYFSNISDDKQLYAEIESIVANELTAGNSSSFLNAIKQPYINNRELTDDIREIAYKVIADYIHTNEYVAVDLKLFNPDDKQLMKDILRYKAARKNILPPN